MNIGSYNSDSIGTLFSSLSGSSRYSSTSLSGIYENLGELSSVKSGSYYKLLRSYYAKEEAGETSTSTSGSTTKELANQKSTSEDLIASAEDLYKGTSLWKKNAEGNYDMDAIYKAVSAFAEDYNATIKASSSSEVTGIANAAASMVNQNTANASLLKQVGITMDSSTLKLSVDEETFKKADISKIKSLFSGTGSYAYQIGAKASMINSAATIEASKANTYTNRGNFSDNYSSGSLYDSIT